MKNLCSKKVTPEKAYEVWSNGTWTYYVLKKYQNPEHEAKNPYARWYCMTTSPITPQGEFGDAYVSTVKTGTHLIANLLVQTSGGHDGLLPKDIEAQLPPLNSQEHNPDPMVMVKFFHPLSDWTWYAFEYSPEERLFFGRVVGFEKEIGYFSLDEFEAIETQLGVPMERDVSFKPMKLSEVKQLHAERPYSQTTIIFYLIEDDTEQEGE